MHESGLLLTLTGSLAAALVLGFLTHRLRLSPIVGYLLAGVLVGPYTPGFVADRGLANEFAEIGVILLMFGVGLHFQIKDLLAVKVVAITGAFGQSAVATALGALAGRAFGWSWSASIVFGMALSVASTVMLTRVLADNHDLQSPKGRIAVGWLVVEDILTVVVLVLLPTLFSPTSVGMGHVAAAVATTTAKLALSGVLIFVLGGRAIPRILNSVAVTQSRELFTLAVLVLALGIAIGSSLVFGVSMALGAFLAGIVVGRSEFSFRAASDALPMRDAFAVLFFVSVGMLLNPRALLATPWMLLATVSIVLLAKPAIAFLIVTLMGYGSAIAVSVAAVLAQIGEFSLILATAGDRLGILPDGASNLIIAAALISLTLNPILYRSAGWLAATLTRSPALWRRLNFRVREANVERGELEPSSGATYHAVVVGYGPVGRTLSRLLGDGGIEPVVIDANVESTRRVRADGRRAIYGDATNPETLDAAGIRDAVALVICGPNSEQTAEIIRLVRGKNPNVRVLARSYYLRETAILREAGANEVFSGEGEVALAMTEYILRMLGATPEQMDRERQRVREEVFISGRTPTEPPPSGASLQ